MNIITSINLDFGRDTFPIYVFAKQGDQESRFVEIVPLNNGQSYVLEDGITARIGCTKPDGTTVLNNCTITDGKIYAELTSQILAVHGLVTADIGLYKGTALLSSQVFYVKVAKTAYDPDAPVSSDEFNALIDAFNQVDNLNAWVEQTETGATIYITDKEGVTHSAHVDTKTSINGWDDIKYAIRNGLGPALFPVGTEFTVDKEVQISISVGADNTGVTAATIVEETFMHKIGEAHDGHYEAVFDGDEWRDEHNNVIILSEYGISTTGTPASGDKVIVAETASHIVFVVRDHDNDGIGPADAHYNHSMVIEAKYVYSNNVGTQVSIQNDAAEALWYCSEALPAGTYNFTWNYETGSMVNGTYQFTLNESVPEGGQIVLGTNSSSTEITSCKIATYGSVGSTTPIESNIVVSSGSAGTSLGTLNDRTSTDEDLNCAQRVMWGSNNYLQSGLRQWLNSSAKKGNVWAPTNKFDRPTSWASSGDNNYAGFVHGLGDDFLGAVLTAKVPYRTNSYFEVDSLDGTEQVKDTVYNVEDKFFVLSRPEVYGDYDSSSLKDGVLLDYYDGMSQSDHIRRDVGGTARSAWLRSPYPWYAFDVRIVNAAGSLTSNGAFNGRGVAPACLIG